MTQEEYTQLMQRSFEASNIQNAIKKLNEVKRLIESSHAEFYLKIKHGEKDYHYPLEMIGTKILKDYYKYLDESIRELEEKFEKL